MSNIYKRRKRKSKARALVIVVILLILSAIASATFVFWDDIFTLFYKDDALAVDGNYNGIVLSTSNVDKFASLSTYEEQTAYIDEIVQFAKDSGMNSIFVEMMHGTGETAVVFGKDRVLESLDNIKANFTFFSKPDPMKYLSQKASEEQIALYGIYEKPTETDTTLEKVAKRATAKYKLANVYYINTPEEGEAIAALSAMDGTSTLPYTTQTAWTDATSVFLQTLNADYNGIVIDDYEFATKFTEQFLLMENAIQAIGDEPILLDYAPSETLNITYPENGATIYTGTCFVMGASNPNTPLYMNGAEIQRQSQTGLFGVLVNVSAGENVFNFTQEGSEYALTINVPVPTGGSSSGSTTMQSDGTVEVEEGTYVEVANWISSLLYDPSNDGNINETVRKGGVAKVVNCVETVRSGKKTWAYQLTSGDYILAYNSTALGKDITPLTISSASATAIDNGKTELVTFAGTGTPMTYTTVDENTLSVRMYDTQVSPDFAVANSTMILSTQINDLENGGKEILFQFAQPLYGYSIEYADGAMQLYLKQTPTRSETPFKPLEGVSVLLDAGHGDTDTGAMGVAGREEPQEKDVNLAVTLGAKYRLEQLGATVYTIRTDDTFLTLAERNAKITEYRPDFFISIHHNSIALTVDVNTVSGTECYYFYNSGKALAQSLVQNAIAQTGRQDRGVAWGYYYVARNTMCPAVLFECGFMVNPVEYENIVDAENLWRMGDAIAQSVLAQVK